jgi:hypothetical protein
MIEATQTTAESVPLAAQATEFVDNIAGFVAPLADALMPLLGPKLTVAFPWVVTALVAALPVAIALWPIMYRVADVIPGNLDTWLLARLGALLERLAKWLLRRDVQLVERGTLEEQGLPTTAREVVAGLSEAEIEAAKKDAGLE